MDIPGKICLELIALVIKYNMQLISSTVYKNGLLFEY